jgi:hypothetical protein
MMGAREDEHLSKAIHLSVRLNTDFSRLVILGGDGDKQLFPLWNKKTRLGACWTYTRWWSES